VNYLSRDFTLSPGLDCLIHRSCEQSVSGKKAQTHSVTLARRSVSAQTVNSRSALRSRSMLNRFLQRLLAAPPDFQLAPIGAPLRQ